jgi:acyl dehydratase/CBS domain-containing protein
MLVSLSVRDVMTRDVLTVTPDTAVVNVAERLAATDAGSLVVCAESEPIGIVTRSDLVEVLAAREDPGRTLVVDVMSVDLVTVGPDEPIENAAELLDEHGIGHLPVVETDDEDDEGNGHIVGVVSTTDLSHYLPYLGRTRHALERLRRTPGGPDTAYGDRDWHFEHEGVEDGLTVDDRIHFRKRLSEGDVAAFADATGDTNRVHLDEAFAEQTRFAGRIAHGILTAGLVSAALARLPGLTIYLSQELSFLGPVRIGETVTAVCQVLEDLGGGKFRLSTTVYDEDGDAVIDGEAVVLVDELPADVDAEAEADVEAADASEDED